MRRRTRPTARPRSFAATSSTLIAERRRSPRDDMIGALAEARVDGGRLSDDEIVSTVIVLLNAGHEATVNTLGNGIRALAPPSRAVAAPSSTGKSTPRVRSRS